MANAALVDRLEQIAAAESSSRRARTLRNAAHSLSLYPLRVTSGQQAAQLQHIGPTIAELINVELLSLGTHGAANASGTLGVAAACASRCAMAQAVHPPQQQQQQPTKRRRKDA
eukprot:SAG31_NODE_17331_length_675_cov_0.534722_1_plen_113_part_10